ncbi:hypothetical protein LRP50_08420 [Enterovibrio sp. ZSDZ42]|uniref:Uncharacterized protein n=1 Tax=Enterovibrio gelatinilyticus TaxID=2899819 RepID=A0ABT5QYP7_9GAMM|nr:hypothetical protein [Enterovibrio sp. ZSDZ42]MDD1793147.1 hypothetical protein [Enterovibrio sp. ZSDZ42]
MCKQVNYSKYQKRVIKFLSDFLGSETPFSYERTQTNHLKVLIDGVPKPLYTGSTPSDCKSINNFMAEVKREVKASLAPVEEEKKPIHLPAVVQRQCHDKLIQSCVKSLRTRLDVMKTQEESNVLAAKNVSQVTDFRMEATKHAIKFALQARKQGSYIKPKEMREIEARILKHLNFMMPTMAYYADLLAKKDKYLLTAANTELMTETAQPLPSTLVTSEVIEAERQDAEPERKVQPEVVKVCSTEKDSATELMGMSTANRVSLLRKLTKTQALTLIDDINQAVALNRDEDVAAVVAMIKEKDLPLEAIISRLEAA